MTTERRCAKLQDQGTSRSKVKRKRNWDNEHRETASLMYNFVQKTNSTKQLWRYFIPTSPLNFFTRFSPADPFWRSSGYLSILSFWRNQALGEPTNRFPLVWEKSSDGKWLKTVFEKKCPRTDISRGNARDEICAFKFAPSRHAIWFAYIFFCVWLGLFVDCWWLKEVRYAPDFLSKCSTRVLFAVQGIPRSPSKRICRGTLSQKTRKYPPAIVSRYMVHVCCHKTRGDGASTRPSLSTTWLKYESCFGSKTSWCSNSWSTW